MRIIHVSNIFFYYCNKYVKVIKDVVVLIIVLVATSKWWVKSGRCESESPTGRKDRRTDRKTDRQQSDPIRNSVFFFF